MDGIEPHWWWIGGGLVLAALELMVPGVYLIWLALAAIATGILAAIAVPALTVQIVTFVTLSLIFAYSSRRILKDSPIESPDPMMNNRAARLVGQVAIVAHGIAGGEGRVRIGDSEWLASGPDCPPGTRVRISSVEGNRLAVTPMPPSGDSPLVAD